MKCSKCGAEIREGAIFCGVCGEKATASDTDIPIPECKTVSAEDNKNQKINKKLVIIAVVLLTVVFAILLIPKLFDREVTSALPSKEESAFQYIGHELSEFSHLHLIKNGGLQTMSQLGLATDGCEYYRSYSENTSSERAYFSVGNNLVSAAAVFNYSGTVNDLINDKYPDFSKQEPRVDIEIDGMLVNLYWETSDGVLCIYSQNYDYDGQSKNSYGGYNVIWYVEFEGDFDYDPESPMQHPQNLLDYLISNNYSISDVSWNGNPIDWIIEGSIYDCYMWENGLPGCLLVEIEDPFRIYRIDSVYPATEPYLVWEGQADTKLDTNNDSYGDIELDNFVPAPKGIKFGTYYDTTGNSTLSINEIINDQSFLFELSLYRIGAYSGSIFATEQGEILFFARSYQNEDVTVSGGVLLDGDMITLTVSESDNLFYGSMHFVHEDSYAPTDYDEKSVLPDNNQNLLEPVIDPIYMWDGHDVFSAFFTEYFIDDEVIGWEHLGINGDYFVLPGNDEPEWVDIYRVYINDGSSDCYYIIPYGEIQLTEVYKSTNGKDTELVWSIPLKEYYKWMN